MKDARLWRKMDWLLLQTRERKNPFWLLLPGQFSKNFYRRSLSPECLRCPLKRYVMHSLTYQSICKNEEPIFSTFPNFLPSGFERANIGQRQDLPRLSKDQEVWWGLWSQVFCNWDCSWRLYQGTHGVIRVSSIWLIIFTCREAARSCRSVGRKK